MARTYWSQDDPDREYIEERIRHQVNKLMTACRLFPHEREDMAQEFRLDLLQRLESFDPGKASRRTYISRLIRHHAQTLADARYAKRRDPRREAGSLDRPVDPGDSESLTFNEALDTDVYNANLKGSLRLEYKQDLALSVSRVLARLPPFHRDICMLMIEGYSVSDIGRILNIHRSTVYDRLDLIRKRFRDVGLGAGD